MAKKSLAFVLQNLEVNESVEVNYGYMVVMVTVSRVKKEFGNSDKKFGVLKVDEKVTSVKRLK
ncbi:MAG: hypothetical protein IM591_13930 [Chitinophagaceae bacterium]|jgi:hypothetical protein|uniref:hypothetical protein n=1 Tax=Microcystis sp. M061S2 TaxID=2771171 RepID=UPI002588D642|nr:hypothetical protein [Microcystis sp. M061S2]MCA2656617.1 hypothetical protein [Microcystis sp. M061S2]MCA6471476.1 hypothetical protein [Chitinophagaceae bacterium]